MGHLGLGMVLKHHFGAVVLLAVLLTIACSVLGVLGVLARWMYLTYAVRPDAALRRSVAGSLCVVVGGSKGLGLETARMLALAGADVVVVARGRAALDVAVADINTSLSTSSSSSSSKVIPINDSIHDPIRKTSSSTSQSPASHASSTTSTTTATSASMTTVSRSPRRRGDRVTSNDKSSMSTSKDSQPRCGTVRAAIADASDIDSLRIAMEEAMRSTGHTRINWVIAAAGGAEPGFLASQTPRYLPKDINNDDNNDNNNDNDDEDRDAFAAMTALNYTTAVNTVRAAMSACARNCTKTSTTIAWGKRRFVGLPDSQTSAHSVPTRVILVGSVLSTVSFAGYGAYASAKYAVRGLADALRSELAAVDCIVQLFLPGNMATDGFERENAAKPAVTAAIEGASAVVSPTNAARALIAGVLAGRAAFSNDALGELLRSATQGAAPRYAISGGVLTQLGGVVDVVAETAASPLLTIALQGFAAIASAAVRSSSVKEKTT